eukprot:NODE_4424_length_581_cov_121.129699_g3209_i0.p2 GENE.NODE_4424_length_581_cov_121.129699_g3209_i0~~NODE_4424_length_581_cov_121.129699_g3209_i0.p2  ORF type:complete len:89 (-),score=27.96 NODE_4424_length_581_cov_121.129699_g3209_i0:147-413(-)
MGPGRKLSTAEEKRLFDRLSAVPKPKAQTLPEAVRKDYRKIGEDEIEALTERLSRVPERHKPPPKITIPQKDDQKEKPGISRMSGVWQ